MKGPSPNNAEFLSHTLPGVADTNHWERLEDHLLQVADLASNKSSVFGARDWGYLAGVWHDIGKYSSQFQGYLRSAGGADAHIETVTKVDHATAGAQHAARTIIPWGRLLAYILAGHHAGLADAAGQRSSLESRLRKAIDSYSSAPERFLNPGLTLEKPRLIYDTSSQDAVAFQLAFFTRMIFSCLVDADFLATERFMSPDRSELRPKYTTTLTEMLSSLDATLREKESTSSATLVTQCRREVLESCRAIAAEPTGFFSLTVPTGGGKTLSSLAFALRHAIQHGKSRIIYAVPFTSIIEQTAQVFRDVFRNLAEDVVLEHHSNVDPEQENYQSRLACENWDAPLVVTTNLQLLESLFASKTSRCRKLHNIVNSVIVLDEAQTLPVELLSPCLSALKELARNYRCTVVLCTATQPAIDYREDFPIGLNNVREIVSAPSRLYQDMRRVTVRQLGKLSDDELVETFAGHPSFLTIVNTRPHAAKLYRLMLEREGDRESLFQLSTLMCGQHRSDVIAEIRDRLARQLPCRVISTQLIEAGVDVDFPVVFRSMTGIDSIAQAAGRCNREGKQLTGDVFVFDAAEVRLRGYLAAVAETAREVAPDFDDRTLSGSSCRFHSWKRPSPASPVSFGR